MNYNLFTIYKTRISGFISLHAKRDPVGFVLTLLTLLVTFLFVWWHVHLGQVRYIDVDEFAHLHWAAQFARGEKPYVDFFYFIPPGFLVFLAPIFWMGAAAAKAVLLGRLVMAFVFIALCVEVGVLFWYMRRSTVALVAPLLLAFLPLPFDKYLEIRPDTVATVLGMAGLISQLIYMRTEVKKVGIISGLLYGMSIMVLSKMIPQVAFAVAFHLLWSSARGKGTVWERAKRTSLYFLVGLSVPVLLFIVYIVFIGNIDQSIYSVVKMPTEVAKLSQYFIMMPDLFFYPNAILYGSDGYNQGLLTNHVVWIVGLLVGAFRLLTPYNLRGKSGWWEEVLIAGTFFTHILFYVVITPLRHTQYLIPIGFFVTFYAADSLWSLWEKAKGKVAVKAIMAMSYVIFVLFLSDTFIQVNAPKESWTNTEAFVEMDRLAQKIPTNAYVLDLDGRMMGYSNPHYACCLPVGQFAHFLSRPLSSLSQALAATQTKYIYQGELKRVGTLSYEDQQFISQNYRETEGGHLLEAINW